MEYAAPWNKSAYVILKCYIYYSRTAYYLYWGIHIYISVFLSDYLNKRVHIIGHINGSSINSFIAKR